MAATGDRAAQFPAIERRYGEPVTYWFARLTDLGDDRYNSQMAYLQEEHGFSRAHANTLIMYARGSVSTKRFDDVEGYFAQMPEPHASTGRKILASIQRRHRDFDSVVAWNKPMLRRGSDYVFGVAGASTHLLLLPWGDGVLEHVADRVGSLVVKKKTIQVPADWKVDAGLLEALVAERLRQLDEA